MSIRRERNHDRVATTFSWRDHPVGKLAKILCYLVGQQAAEKSHGRVSAIPRSTLWAEVVTKRMPYPSCPPYGPRAPGDRSRRARSTIALYYMYREHQNGGGPGRLIEAVSGEHPTRSLRLRRYVAAVRICFERIGGEIPRDLAEWVCSEPAPSGDDVLAKLATLNAPQPTEEEVAG